MRVYLFILILLMSAYQALSQGGTRPKIGLTLSGGGAKGLAHIGILKALDSAGLKIDYITGTSMGSIVGSLYAVGYSGEQIEKIARNINWDQLLTNGSSLRALVMEEKEEYDKYAIELPWINHRFKLPTGFLESEELWLKFSELYFPVYNIKDFSKFSIPFKCVAADVATGQGVVLDKGEIVTAIRASMAIPTVFTAVEHEDHKLIDGGVVRNFPVKDVREMGADFVIGSNVATGLLPKEKVNNALQVLLQIAFFKESEDSRKEKELCDIYIPMPVENYNTASFNKSSELLELGIEEGKKLYPRFKRLADSLNALYGTVTPEKDRLAKVDSIFIRDIEIHGLKNTTEGFFKHMMGFYDNRYYTSARIAEMVRKVFGTRYYSRILYSLVPAADSTVKIVFAVAENPRSFAKLGLHYNKFTGIGIVANLTTRNFLSPHSRSLFTVNIGEKFRFRSEHMQYLGRSKNVAAIGGVQYEFLSIPTFTDYKKDGEYKQSYFRSDLRMQYSANRVFTVGAGTRFEWIKYKPTIQTNFEIKGKNDFVTGYAYWGINTLDRAVLPRKGIRIDGEAGLVFNQTPYIKVYEGGIEIPSDSLGIRFNDYQRAWMNMETYSRLGSRFTLSTLTQLGVNFNYDQNFFNDFVIGGLTRMFRNQVLFAGLEEGSFFTTSVASLQLGLRFNITNNLYVTGRTNGLMNNFISTDNRLQAPRYLTGHSFTLGYNFAMGPLEVSTMYCDQSKRVVSYINIGIPF